MAKQKFGLGRGLDALITGAKDAIAAQQVPYPDEHNILEVAVDSMIPNPRQPRRIFREDDPKLLELSASIKEHGLLQPLIVTRLDTPTSATTPNTAPRASGSDSWFTEDEQANEAPLLQAGFLSTETTETTETMETMETSVVPQGSPSHPTSLPPYGHDDLLPKNLRLRDGAPPRTPTAMGAGYTTTVVQFQIIAGERRWRAARLAGLTKVPVIIKEATPQEMLELALIENIQRADLNPIEEALAYQTLIQEFGLTQEMVAKQVGKDRSTITNAIRLLQLAPKVREALINQPEHFSEGHARALIGIAREEDQIAAMGKIITERLNVRQAEELAARIKGTQRAATPLQQGIPRRSADLDELETQFRNALTVKVDLKYNVRGKGTLVLHFNNQEELERLYNKLVKHED